MKRTFTLILALVAMVAARAADYQLELTYARAYVMDSEKHQFQLEFVNTATYEGQGSIYFCAKDNNHLNGQYAISSPDCTATLVVGEEQVFEAVAGSFSIQYSHEASYMHYYTISGTLTDADGKTLDVSGAFGSYSAYDYASYENYLLGLIDYTELVSYDLNDYLDAVVDYDVVECDSVSGFSMYNYYVKQYGFEVASWRISLYNQRRLIAQMVVYTNDNAHLAGTYDCSRNTVTYFDSSVSAEANSGIYSIAFDHKTDSVAYYTLKGSLQYSQGAINLNCTLPIGDGAMVDYQSMAENYADSTVVVQTVMLKDYEKATEGIAATQKPAAKAEKAYSLSGQQLNALRHPGIYIVNRRKVIVR